MAKKTEDHDHQPETDPAHDRAAGKAAEVVAAVGKDAARLSGKHDKWLTAIHAAPQQHWNSLVQEVLDHSLDLSQLRQRVQEIKAEPPEVGG